MATCTFRDGTIVSDYGTPYVITEVNSSHGGDMETARHLIDCSVKAGADCVKFQSWNKKSLYSETYYRMKKNRLAGRFVDKFSLSENQLKELADYCKDKGTGFSSTPYSKEEVDFLAERTDAPFIKISSMEINNLPYLAYIASKKVPVVLSTGMSEMEEIYRAVSTLEQGGLKDIVILHCVSVYPTELKDINVRNIPALRKKFPGHPIGFSDHTMGNISGILAVGFGAAVLEKHLTPNRQQIGMDNKMATEPDEFVQYIADIRAAAVACGSKERILSEQELEQRKTMRRSVIAAVDIPEGKIIVSSDLDAKRPGDGIPVDQLDKVIGKKAVHAIEADTVIYPEDIA